jgi:hypothetical protein
MAILKDGRFWIGVLVGAVGIPLARGVLAGARKS